MKKKKEAKYLDNGWEEMNLHLKAFLETGNQEELHKFRVQIKKLRAMLFLFENTSKESGLLKCFKPVRKIFKDAGQIRDAHTNLQLSERYHLKNKQFEEGQQKIIEEGTIEFRSNGPQFLKNIKSAHKRLKKQLPKVDDSLIADYYKQQLSNIATNLAVSGFTEDMHTNRKLIKILVYNHKLAEKSLNGSLPFNTAYLDKLQEAIGKWHDNLVAEELFSTPELNDKPIVTKIKKVNSGVKRSIINLADDFLKKATTFEHPVNT
ncbi:CHAD domain-containing protein [Mucilaginibacter sp.]|uniref:CHAD domain-containing protein n=1 Tax=Mucilaginibacter sp. TaxID=1882438 RepID=UPI00284A57C5|nr:CHAD domain-containing protein [Mucilaginibacter sp.]MDR3695877.1 CHAD domain-containing protein [Mucilaginibacter sp.]